MAHSFESPRRKVKRKRERKASAANSRFVFIAAGVLGVVLLVIGLVVSPTVVKLVSEPWNRTILAAQTPFEMAHKADREQNPYRAIWRPLNPGNNRFNVLLPMPYESMKISNKPGNPLQQYLYQSLVEPFNLKSPVAQVALGVVVVPGEQTMSDLISKYTEVDIRTITGCDQIHSNRMVTWKGLKCREMELTMGERRCLLKILPLGNDRYVSLGFDYEGEAPQEQIDRFFNSYVSEAEPEKYESPGWPTAWNQVTDLSMRIQASQMKMREMDRSRWLKIGDDPVDVLAHVDVFKDANCGEWYTFGKGIVSPKVRTSMLVLPVEPIDSYELRLDVRCLSITPESLNIGLVVGGKPAMIVIDGFGSRTTCLHPVDNQPGARSEYVHKRRLLGGWSNSLRIRVTPESVLLNVNGKDILNFEGNPSRLGLDGFWLPPDNALFLGAWETQYYISRCELRRL